MSNKQLYRLFLGALGACLVGLMGIAAFGLLLAIVEIWRQL